MPPAEPDTTELVHQALSGDPQGLSQLVVRISPWLIVQASYRLGPLLRRLYDPEDLVQDVWLAILPKLADLARPDRRQTPVVVKYLSAALLYRVQNLIEKHLSGKPTMLETSGGGPGLDRLSESVTGAFTSLVMRERKDLLEQALATLEERERALIVLRGIEQHRVAEVAAVLSLTPNAVSVGYRRACHKLRSRLGGVLLDDLLEP